MRYLMKFGYVKEDNQYILYGQNNDVILKTDRLKWSIDQFMRNRNIIAYKVKEIKDGTEYEN